MRNLNKTAILILSLVLAGSASAAGKSGTSADYGQPAPESAYARVVTLAEGASSVNVTDGETVTFALGGQRFTWDVRTFPNDAAFKLSEIAPAGVAAEGITVYVAPNPLYIGG